jgi:hypothetical protein
MECAELIETRARATTDIQVLLLARSIRPGPDYLIAIDIQPALLHIIKEGGLSIVPRTPNRDSNAEQNLNTACSSSR